MITVLNKCSYGSLGFACICSVFLILTSKPIIGFVGGGYGFYRILCLTASQRFLAASQRVTVFRGSGAYIRISSYPSLSDTLHLTISIFFARFDWHVCARDVLRLTVKNSATLALKKSRILDNCGCRAGRSGNASSASHVQCCLFSVGFTGPQRSVDGIAVGSGVG